MGTNKIIAEDLVSRGYFFPELPPVFNSRDFGGKYQTLFKSEDLRNISNSKTLSSSECVYYAIPKAGYGRRVLGIPNPLHYATLAEVLEKNSKNIFRALKSKVSCSIPVADPYIRAFKTFKTFAAFRRHCFLISEESTFELKVDISRYYSTIYTHIIPWVLHGRLQAKKKQRDVSLLGNIIDKHVRALQSGQTMGIPIGPDASFVISELIGCRLDNELSTKFPKLKAARYIDDYYFYFSTRADAELVLKFLQSLLSDHLLSVNDEKTSLREFPFSTDPAWVVSLRSLKATCFKDDTEPEQEGDIRQFFSAAFDWAEQYPKGEVMKFAVRTLYGAKISDSNWDYFEAWIIKMGLYDPYTLPEICTILFTNRKRVRKKSVQAFIHQLLEKHLSKRHSFEVSWTLWLARIMQIKIKTSLATKIFDSNDVVSILLGLDLKNKGIIGKRVKTSHLNIELNTEALMDNRWLLAYEAGIKGWLKPTKANIKYMTSHPFFSKLQKGGVTFYNDSALQAEIPAEVRFLGGKLKNKKNEDFFGNLTSNYDL